MDWGECDSCPNRVEGARYGHEFDEHNDFFYELHVFNSHPDHQAKEIIRGYYVRFPEKLNAERMFVIWPGRQAEGCWPGPFRED